MLHFVFGGVILLFTLFPSDIFCEDKLPFRDPHFPLIEEATYQINTKGKVHLSIHTISRANHGGLGVYVISTHTQKLVVRADDLRPLSITQTNETGETEFTIEYYKQNGEPRARFIYPGPERNTVKEISEDSYDVNTILEVLRCYPFQEKEVKFTLVTADHVVGVYAKIKGEEALTTPLGTFDCYLIETGVSGFKGKIIRTKFLFWVEKKPPHRLIKQKDSDDENILTLVEYKVLPAQGKVESPKD